MGFLESYRNARDGKSTDRFTVNGMVVECSHCKHTRFDVREAQLNTAGATFFNLDWANASATVLVCKQCGKLEWFLSDPQFVE